MSKFYFKKGIKQLHDNDQMIPLTLALCRQRERGL
jgi:hypothetical protein